MKNSKIIVYYDVVRVTTPKSENRIPQTQEETDRILDEAIEEFEAQEYVND